MGLSNEERYNKIIYSINNIVELSDSLSQDTAKLKKLAGSLWYAFLKKDSNGAFWIFGSELSNDYMPAGSLVGAAFEAHKPHKEAFEADSEEDTYYDHYKVLKHFVDIEQLLDKEKRAVLLIHLHTQNIAYALCRYKDEFMDRFEDLNFLIRTMQGECFNLMKEDNDYVHAWMLHNLCDKVYTMKEDDIVNQWWTNDCNSHDIRIHHDKFDEVFNLFKKYQFRTLTVQDRIDITLVLMGAKYGEFEHQHKKFVETVNAYNEKHVSRGEDSVPLVNVQAIEDAFKAGKEAKAKKLDEPYERECSFTHNYVNRKGEVENYFE
jgi:hypothetical protein